MPPFNFELKPSRYLLGLLLIMHVGAGFILILLSLPIGVKIISVVGCLISLIYTLRCQVFSAIKIWAEKEGVWHIQIRQNEPMIVKLCSDSICTTLLVILNFVKDSSRFSIPVIIFPDSLTKEDFKKLRKYLLSQQ